MSEATDLDAACLANVLRTGPIPKVEGGADITVTRLLAGAIRALAARAAPAAPADDGIRLMDLARYRAEKGDVVVAYSPGHLSEAQRAALYHALHSAFPSNRVLLSEGGIGLEVIHAAESPADSTEPGAS